VFASQGYARVKAASHHDRIDLIGSGCQVAVPFCPTAETTGVRATTKFKSMLGGDTIVVAPGAFDGLSARLVEQAGFPAGYASGGAIARSTGVPDLGPLAAAAIARPLAPKAP